MTSDAVRRVTDAKVLTAMAHPLRRRLLDILKVDGPSTASVLSARTGQAIGNLSHHLRVLGACGLIEEVPELARDRRERWWRLVSAGVRWSRSDFRDDPAAAAVAEAAASLNLDHQVQQVRAWAAADDEQRQLWDDSAFSFNWWLRLTPAELRELAVEINEVLDRWSRRPEAEDHPQRRPVFLFAHGVPAQP